MAGTIFSGWYPPINPPPNSYRREPTLQTQSRKPPDESRARVLVGNPFSIRMLPTGGDWELQNALLIAKGEGRELPSPSIKKWRFTNRLQVEAYEARDMLLAGLVYYNARVSYLYKLDEVPITPPIAEHLGIPFSDVERYTLTEEELEKFLLKIQMLELKA